MAGIQLAPPPSEFSDNLAQALMQQGMSNSPIVTPFQGLGKLAQALTGAYLDKKYQTDKANYAQSHRDALTQALMGSMSAPPMSLTQPNPDAMTAPGPLDNPMGTLAKTLINRPDTQDAGNQILLQLASQQQKEQPSGGWEPVSEKEKKDLNLNPYQTYQKNNDKTSPDYGKILPVGSPSYDPSQVFKQQTTVTHDENGNLVKRVIGYNKQGDAISTNDMPALGKPLPAPEQKEYEGVTSTASISQLMRDVLTQGAGQNWNGPVSGPLAMKMQQMGFNDAGGTYAEAFAALKSHYTLALTQLAGSSRGKWILEQLDKITPEAQYSTDRNLMQLDLTDGLLKNKAARIVHGYANTQYEIPPDLWQMAQSGGFDPQHPEKVVKDYMPSIADKLQPQAGPPNSEIRQAKDGKLYYFDRTTKKNLGAVGG